VRFKLDFGNFTFTDADTMGGVAWKREINSGDDFAYGTAAMAEVKFAILAESLPDGVTLDDRTFDLYISQVESGDAVWEDYGIFTVKTVVKSGHKLEITAYDNMSKFDIIVDEWLSTLTYPLSVLTLLSYLCNHCGVQFGDVSLANSNYSIKENFGASGITGRQVLSFIAEITATFAFIQYGNESGKLSLKPLSENNAQLDRSMYRTAKIAEYTVLPADKVQIRTSENDIGVVYGTGDNAYIVENNPLLYTSSAALLNPVAIGLYNPLSSVTYTPATVELFRDYGIDTGDYYTINGVKSLVMSKTMKPGGVTFTCSGNPRRSQTVSGGSYELMMLRGRSNVLERTLEETLSRITDAEGNISTVSQTANKINWLVKSGTSASNFTLTDRMVTLISDNITLKGKTIALTADSINITSTYFNVATSGAVACTSLAVTGGNSSVLISGSSTETTLIKAMYSVQPNTYAEMRPSGFVATDYTTGGYGLVSGAGMQITGNNYGYSQTNTQRMNGITLYSQMTGNNYFQASAAGVGAGLDNVIVFGNFMVGYGTKNKLETTEHYGNRLMYSLESSSPMYSDFGRATIADDGLCYVFLDPVFYECIDNNYDYFVFIQPENGGEFAVIDRTSDHFTVRGTPGELFAWMLVTTQKGYSATRTEELILPEPEPAQTPDPENAVCDAVGDEILKEFENQLG
jgi:hypothetical protein